MRRALTWIAGGLGLAALLRLRRKSEPVAHGTADPARELRLKLAEARGAGDDRDEFDAAEGTPVDAAEPAVGQPALSVEERRTAIHAKAQETLGAMHDTPEA